ncbi:hypothetical protein TW65_01208 [Stemphylium lycopersici]|nr:hypothetical protein TW65_01208 [Stemphylium lycopersici]
MTVFSGKEAFKCFGLEPMKQSYAHASQDCPICLDPLALHLNQPHQPHSKLHAAVRITACSHLVGKECLDAWIDVGNTCPTCNRLLFEATGDPITQQDVSRITQSLGPGYGERAVMMVVARLMAHEEREQARQKQTHKVEMDKMRTKENQVNDDGFALFEYDFYDSDKDMDFGEDEDEDDDYAEGEEEEEEEAIARLYSWGPTRVLPSDQGSDPSRSSHEGTRRSTAYDDKCGVCWETESDAPKPRSLITRLRDPKHATMTLLFRPGTGNGFLMTCITPSPYNCMLRIKACGHCFCYDCLERWAKKHNTCPICRAVLFGQQCKKNMGEDAESWLRSREYLDIRDMGEPAARRMHGNSGNQGHYGLREHGQQNALPPAVVQERGGEGMTGPPGDTVDVLGDSDLPLQNWESVVESAVEDGCGGRRKG